MKLLPAFYLACLPIVLTPALALSQEANPKPRREPLVVTQPGSSPSTEEACAREQRAREKRRAQGLPVGPLNRTSPCRSMAAPQIKEKPLRKAEDGGMRRLDVEFQPADGRSKRIRQNTGGSEPPKLR